MPEDFSRGSVEVAPPVRGQRLSSTIWLSRDHNLRNVMKGHVICGVKLTRGDTMCGEAVAQVVESRHPQFAAGNYVIVMSDWQDYALSNGEGGCKFDQSAAPLSTVVGALSMSGLTGYVGLVNLAEPKPGETVVVYAATGARDNTVG